MEAGGNVQEAKKQGGAGSDQDLSMEEILQSIRRIIAEDDGDKKSDESSETPAKAASAGKGENVPGSDVLELTEMLKEDGSIVNVKDEADTAKEAPAPKTAKPEPAGKADPAKKESTDVLAKINEALTPPEEEKPEGPAEAEAETEATADEAPAEPEDKPEETAVDAPTPESQAALASKLDSLLSAEAAAAAAAQFKRLGDNTAEDVSIPSPPFRSGSTVEDLVTEMLRPMMKAWLDTNLPQIVERIVEREVRKLTK